MCGAAWEVLGPGPHDHRTSNAHREARLKPVGVWAQCGVEVQRKAGGPLSKLLFLASTALLLS